MTDNSEKRRFFRVRDQVVLYVRLVPKEKSKETLANFQHNRSHFSLPNSLKVEREEHLPDFKIIENQYPEVAAYLHYLEEQIMRVAALVGLRDIDFSSEPRIEVDISAQGLGFVSKEAYESGSLLEICLILFPSLTRIFVYAEVVRCEAGDGAYKIAVDFKEIFETDRELLIKHIHQVQIRALQKNIE